MRLPLRLIGIELALATTCVLWALIIRLLNIMGAA